MVLLIEAIKLSDVVTLSSLKLVVLIKLRYWTRDRDAHCFRVIGMTWARVEEIKVVYDDVVN